MGNSQLQRTMRTFLKNKLAIAGLFIILLLIPVAILTPFISPYDPLAQNVFHRLAKPELSHLLGTDNLGRDVLSRIILGVRVSLLVAFLSVFLGMTVGTIFGTVAGYKGRKVENIIMRGVDILMSFPDEVLGILIMVVIGSGLFKLIIVIGVLLIPRFARLAHGTVLSLREREFVEAGRAIGINDFRIITRHILPNILGDVVVMGALWIGLAIRLEANLSFLGLGVSPPTPSWGNMIRAGIDHLTNAPWLSVFPGIAIMIAVLAFNMLGDGLRDVTDPKLRY
ncbi:MAG: ABC transporter permease [Candidatus Hodarchaeota archaeon]